VPRKNIRLLAGKPLIAYSIETARASRLIDRVIVSTDDPEIAAVAREYGAEVPFLRPAELAQDHSPEWLTWQHAIKSLADHPDFPPIEVFVCVSPTSPLRTVADVDSCIQKLLESDADLVLTIRPAERSPYFNMVTLDPQGYAHLVIPRQQAIHRRQDAPTVYDLTTVAYAARPGFVLGATAMFQGSIQAVEVPPERALDIDTELDFQIAEFLMTRTQSPAEQQ
jgi:N-acylneuraminate cytidylyltransferase